MANYRTIVLSGMLIKCLERPAHAGLTEFEAETWRKLPDEAN